MQKVEISIIVVAYKAQQVFLNCLESIYLLKHSNPYEVIVVDNNEKNEVVEAVVRKFHGIKYIRSKQNIGYGAGINLGETVATGKYLFCLNQDIQVENNTIEELTRWFTDSKRAITSPSLIKSDRSLYEKTGSGTLDPKSAIFALSFLNKLFPNNPISKKYFLRDVDRSKPISVNVVPGSAFMIRHDVFKKIGGFDEKFFLYFEESDLCKRVKESGYDIWIVPNAKVIHGWGKSTTKGEKINKIFEKSRMYYFKKHYGLFWMALVEVFCRFSKYMALLVLITGVGVLLRFWNFSSHMTFHGELGHNYLAAKDFFENRQFPLIGPPTSHPWLSFSPLFYWIIVPVLFITNWNPVGPAIFMALVHSFLPLITYFSFQKMLTRKGSLIAAFLVAISPFMINLSREARFFSLSIFPLLPFVYYAYRKKYTLAAFLLSLSLSFHYTPLTLVPAFLYLLYRSKPNKKQITNVVLVTLIPHIPYLLHLIVVEPITVLKILEWIPYRFIRFSGIIAKDAPVDPGTNIAQFLSLLFTSANSLFLGLGIIGMLVVSKKQLLLFFLAVTGTIGLIIHGDPPVHYYIALIPFILGLVAFFLQNSNRFVLLCFSLILFLVNTPFYFGNDDRFNRGLIPYSTQVTIMHEITQKMTGVPYRLERRGPNDQFEGTYAQNYWYLGWLEGNRPTSTSDATVVIYEEGKTITYEIK